MQAAMTLRISVQSARVIVAAPSPAPPVVQSAESSANLSSPVCYNWTMKKSQSGTYMILNNISGTRYIGSAARSVSQRWQEHRYALRRGFHRNPYLQNAWNKYGESAFAGRGCDET